MRAWPSLLGVLGYPPKYTARASRRIGTLRLLRMNLVGVRPHGPILISECGEKGAWLW